jgi:Cu(I)/Ag(I) efflux system membrane fusion protein
MYKSVLVEAGFEGVVLPEDATDEAKLGSRIQILKGLNEGDRIVTSAQFLIDSESNIDAELARLEQGESSMDMSSVDEASASNSVRAKGKVNKIMSGMVNLTHDPIPEWDWPTMKMDFQVSGSVDLNMLKEGDKIQFEVQKTGDWDYLIVDIGDSEGEMQNAASSDMKIPDMKTLDTKSVSATGKVKSLMLDMNMIEVVHEPISEWGWPVMSMSFLIAADQKLPSLEVGDQISFALKEREDGDYEISSVRKK